MWPLIIFRKKMISDQIELLLKNAQKEYDKLVGKDYSTCHRKFPWSRQVPFAS